MSDPYLDLYDKNCLVGSDINAHLPTFVDLVKTLDARIVIELGVRDGVSTSAWLHALNQTNGHLWSVDVNAAPALPATERWTFVCGDDISPWVVEQLPWTVDIVFIDTSHHYQHTLNELAMYAPRVRHGGRIVLHDTEVEHPDFVPQSDPDFPVKRAVDMFCLANGFDWTNEPKNNGLGIIEVR